MKEKKEVLDQKEERKKLYRRYLQLLKMKKEIIESKGYFSLYFYHFFSVDIKENVDLEKIFNEIVELKLKSFFLLWDNKCEQRKINEKLIDEVKQEKNIKATMKNNDENALCSGIEKKLEIVHYLKLLSIMI